MKKLTAFLSVSLLILAFPLSALSGDKQQFCNSYADKAVSQYNLGKQHNLPGIVPPAWSSDRNAHFFWCMMVPENMADSETAKRQAYLDQHVPKQVASPAVVTGAVKSKEVGGAVAATPISIPRPIKGAGAVGEKASVADAAASRIERAELVSLDKNVMHVRFHYTAGHAVNGEMYGGAFLYDIDHQAIDAGYKPTQPYSAKQGSMDVYLVLPAEPFQAATLETFVLNSGTTFVKQNFKCPFVWNGAKGGVVNPSVIKKGKGTAQNAQMAAKPIPTMPPMSKMKQLNSQAQIIKPGAMPIGLDPGLGP